ncbi:MAG: HAD family hydrolase [Candidatus Limnocylindrales bacterium]
MSQVKLPSWQPGATRDAIEVFLDAAEMLPVERRVAVFDIDGTLWCERPHNPQLEFLVAELRDALAARPELAQRPEYRAVLEWDRAAIARLGAVNVMLALSELHAGRTPEEFEARVAGWFETSRHPEKGVPWSQTRYRPMLELIAELRARHFSVYLATGIGTEFVRVVSQRFFGVPPEGVAGAQVGYELDHASGVPRLLRTREVVGDPNEGAAKVANVIRSLGRRPIFASGSNAGDVQVLEYTSAVEGPSLALLLRHDDADREYAYDGGTAAQPGWTVASMRDDWSTVFADT